MKLEDMTQEQAISIAKLVYGSEEHIRSDFVVKYHPYDESLYEDAYEHLDVRFEAITFADTIDTLTMTILPWLDCHLRYNRGKKVDALPSRNQYKVQKLFREWGIEPNYS